MRESSPTIKKATMLQLAGAVKTGEDPRLSNDTLELRGSFVGLTANPIGLD
jgi:hypothetical protein